jgi:hypothetical protein
MRRTAFLVVHVLAALAIAWPAGAQVTATSGSPAAIARIGAEYATTTRQASAYRRTERDVYDFSLEGGTLQGFYRGGELRRLSARLYGESWRGSEDYYFAGGRLIFIHAVREVYDEPMSGRIQRRLEYRYYFDGDRLIRQVLPSVAGQNAEYLALFAPEVDTLLRNARLFTACAAAPASAGDAACTAPEI